MPLLLFRLLIASKLSITDCMKTDFGQFAEVIFCFWKKRNAVDHQLQSIKLPDAGRRQRRRNVV
jgi:hypothetical protein